MIRRLAPDVVLGHDPVEAVPPAPRPPPRRPARRSTAIVAARDPHFFPERGRTAPPARAPALRGRRSSTTWKRSTRSTSTPRSKPSSATAASGAPPWASKRVPPLPNEQRAAFEDRIRDEIATTGGEPFKLLTDAADATKGPRRAPSQRPLVLTSGAWWRGASRVPASSPSSPYGASPVLAWPQPSSLPRLRVAFLTVRFAAAFFAARLRVAFLTVRLAAAFLAARFAWPS